jgi:hypothetical protein
MGSGISCSIEGGAEFKNASANGLYRSETFDLRGAI